MYVSYHVCSTTVLLLYSLCKNTYTKNKKKKTLWNFRKIRSKSMIAKKRHTYREWPLKNEQCKKDESWSIWCSNTSRSALISIFEHSSTLPGCTDVLWPNQSFRGQFVPTRNKSGLLSREQVRFFTTTCRHSLVVLAVDDANKLHNPLLIKQNWGLLYQYQSQIVSEW